MAPKRDHWVNIPDEILRVIEDGPDVDGIAADDYDGELEELWGWISAVQNAVLDGLETA
jgi:hypothetical protein